MNTLWLDTKYVSMLSSRLRNFKRKNNYSWNCSCPLCGDSKKNQRKARGYIFQSKGTLLFHCHNCSKTIDIPNLIKTLDSNLYGEYTKEKLQSQIDDRKVVDVDHKEFVKKLETPKFISDTPLKSLKKVSVLPLDHPVRKYVEHRKIPPHYHHKLFYAPKFKEFVNQVIPNKFESLDYDEPRLIIPFLDENRNLFGFQGRALKKSELRYITIMLEERPKFFGLDTVNLNKHVYVFEGPIDAMYVPNSIASAGGDITTDLKTLDTNADLFTNVYDNECRNLFTVKKMEKAISKGYPVCIWPTSMQYKDVNEAIMAGMTVDEIHEMIDVNTFKGITAKLQLMMWRKT